LFLHVMPSLLYRDLHSNTACCGAINLHQYLITRFLVCTIMGYRIALRKGL
jgi:hypothetical protein